MPKNRGGSEESEAPLWGSKYHVCAYNPHICILTQTCLLNFQLHSCVSQHLRLHTRKANPSSPFAAHSVSFHLSKWPFPPPGCLSQEVTLTQPLQSHIQSRSMCFNPTSKIRIDSNHWLLPRAHDAHLSPALTWIAVVLSQLVSPLPFLLSVPRPNPYSTFQPG